MRTDLFHDSRLSCQIPDYRENHRPRQLPATPVQKDHIFVMDHRQPAAVNLVQVDLLQRLIAYRNKPLLIALAGYADKAFDCNEYR